MILLFLKKIISKYGRWIWNPAFSNSIKLLNEIGFKNFSKNNFFNPKKISFINAKDNKKICDLDISKFNDQIINTQH